MVARMLLSASLLGTAGVVTLGLRSRVGLGAALMLGLAAAVLDAGAVGLVCLDRDAFTTSSLLRGLALTGLGWVALVVWLRRRWPALARRETPWAAIAGVMLLLALGVGLRLDPSPYLHGGQDQGIYVNVGHHIARTGRLRPVDRAMAGEVPGIPADAIHKAHKIAKQPEDSPLIGVREGRWIAGLHVEDASEGRIVPGFFHLMPSLFALAELALGFARSTWPLVLFAAFAQLAAFALGYRLTAGDAPDRVTHRRALVVGLLAMLGLCLHPLDLWISTFPVTENLARACLLGAAALGLEAQRLERLRQPGAELLGAVAGLVFAAGAFARGSMLALAILLALALVLVRSETPRSRRALLIALVVGATLAAMQAIVHSWPYFFSAASNHFHVPRIQPRKGEAVAWAAAAGAFVLVAELASRTMRRRWPRLDDTDRLARVLGVLALVVAVAAVVYRATDASDKYGPDQQVVRVLLRYCGPLGLGLGLVGVVAALWRARADALAGALLACAIVLLTALKEGVRYEFYYARYLVGDAIPVLMVAAACMLGLLVERVEHRSGRPRAWLIGALLVIGWHAPNLARLGHPVFWTRDLEHGPEDLSAMFEHVPDDAVLMFDARAPGRWRGILAVPAFLSFGKTVLVYPSAAVVERAITGGTPVYLLSGGWEHDDHQRWPANGAFHTTVIARGIYRAQRADVIEGAMPVGLSDWGGPWELQRIDPSIWRGTGALSLHPGSRFVALSSQERIETEMLALTWQPGWFVELLVEPGQLDGCTVAGQLIDASGRTTELTRTSSPTANRIRFALPPGGSARAGVSVSWTCAAAREVTWRRLSVRGT